MGLSDARMPNETDIEAQIARVRGLARRYAAEENLPPELARAVDLVLPQVAFGLNLSERFEPRAKLRARLDYLAGHHFGGYHGWCFNRIMDEAEWVAHMASQPEGEFSPPASSSSA